MRKKYTRIISFVLVTIIIICSCVVPIYAESDTIVEVESLREENVKHFRMPDGSYKAITYDSAVHRKDSNGVWQDIDNKLSEKTKNNNQAYVTDDERAVFSKKIKADSPTVFEINENGYGIKVSFANEGIKNSTAKLSNHAEKYIPSQKDSLKTQYKKLKTIDNSTTLLYKNVLRGTDLEYVLSSNDIKENIIIKESAEEYVYRFVYELDKLKATLRDDGAIILSDSFTNEEKYIIPAPFMYDESGEKSYDVEYHIIELDEGVYEVTVAANAEWINSDERQFPIVVDPSVVNYYMTHDTYVNVLSPDTNYGTSRLLWLSDREDIYVRNANLPTLPDDARITDAILYLYYGFYVTTGEINIDLYQVLFNWSEYHLTWNIANSNPSTDVPITSSTASAADFITEEDPFEASFNIEKLAQMWYTGVPNYGVKLKRSGGTNNSVFFMDRTVSGNTRAMCEITYSSEIIYFENGIYFLKNGELDKYMEIDDDFTNDTVGAKYEIWDFENQSDQKWIFTYLRNGYYKITSAASGMALTAPSDEDDVLRQYQFDYSYDQQWRIRPTQNGMYTLCPRSSLSLYMSASDGFLGIGNGRNVQLRSTRADNLDEWFISQLPLSGGELNYSTSLWNYSPVVYNTNCYSYSLNNQVIPGTNILWRMQPGESAGLELSQSNLTATIVESYVQVDSEVLGFTFEPIGKYEICSENAYKVALVVAPGVDYHWYRQNSNGTWSHKRGTTEVTNLDASGRIIHDPESANRQYLEADYTVFVRLLR